MVAGGSLIAGGFGSEDEGAQGLAGAA